MQIRYDEPNQPTPEALAAGLHADAAAMIRRLMAEANGIDPADLGDDEDDHYVDVRLQVGADGAWAIHVGDPQYDTDHTGYWGSESLPVPCTEDDARETVHALVEQVVDDYAQDEDPNAGPPEFNNYQE